MRLDSFTDIEAWKKARTLVSQIYEICRTQEIKHDYGFKDQIQRAGVSIMANIAEGFDGGSTNSFKLFLTYAYRSASEVESLLYVALDIKYIDDATFQKLVTQTQETKKLIGGFIRYLNSKNS